MITASEKIRLEYWTAAKEQAERMGLEAPANEAKKFLRELADKGVYKAVPRNRMTGML